MSQRLTEMDVQHSVEEPIAEAEQGGLVQNRGTFESDWKSPSRVSPATHYLADCNLDQMSLTMHEPESWLHDMVVRAMNSAGSTC